MTWLDVEDPARPGTFCRVAYVRAEGRGAEGWWLSHAGVAYLLTEEEAVALRGEGQPLGPEPRARSQPTASPAAVPAAPGAPSAPRAHRAAAAGEVVAPAAGRICAVRVARGQQVTAGEPVATLEAMKVELPVSAESGGWVAEVHCAEGDWVESGQALLRLTKEPAR